MANSVSTEWWFSEKVKNNLDREADKLLGLKNNKKSNIGVLKSKWIGKFKRQHGRFPTEQEKELYYEEANLPPRKLKRVTPAVLNRLHNLKDNPSKYHKSKDWRRVRRQVLRRDRYRCKVCNQTSRTLHIHHINYRAFTDKESMDNLITLCVTCHAKQHKVNGPAILEGPKKYA